MFTLRVCQKIMSRQPASSRSQFVHKLSHQNHRKNAFASASFVVQSKKPEAPKDVPPLTPNLHILPVIDHTLPSRKESHDNPSKTCRVASKFSNEPESTNTAVQVRKSSLLNNTVVNTKKEPVKPRILNRNLVKTIDHHFTQTKVSHSEKAINATETMINAETQTSKTVISMPILIHRGQMSPDSLSPKNNATFASSNYTLDGSVSEDDQYIPFTRKNCVINYVDKKKKDMLQINASDNSLTQKFLEKSKKKEEENPNAEPTRSQFLEQTSPLKKVLNIDKFKSKSFAESPKKLTHNHMRFFVKNVREKPEVINYIKPVRYFCPNIEMEHGESGNAHHSKNFMSPTISSEKKNQSKDIENICKLISPTRRGRSESPKQRIMKIVERKVPYIDKSSTLIVDLDPSTGDGDTGDSLQIDLKSSASTGGLPSVASSASNESILYQAIAKLRDPDWNVSLRGLAEVVEVCRVSDSNVLYPHMTTINQRIIELLKSPRSHVCRTTCQAVGHLFEYVKDTRRPEFDEIVDTLLNRTADSNKFIKHDANLALDCMVTHIPTFHAVRALCVKGPEHKNPLVRLATARLMVCCVVIAGAQNVLHPNSNNYTRRRIIVNMVRFLNDKNLHTRQFGERLYRLMSKERVFEIYLKKYLEKDVIVHLKKAMKAPKGDH